MPEPDYDTLWKDWQANPSQESNAKMLRSMDPVIDRAASASVGPMNPLIRGKARSLTLKALQTYNPNQGKLVSHVYNHLKGLKRYAGQTAAGVHVPERIGLDRRAVDAASQELSDQLGREPTEDELSDHSGFSSRRIKRIRGGNSGINEGFFTGLGDDESTLDPAVRSSTTRAWEQLVKDDLAPVDQKILEYHRAGLSNQDIAARLRLTPGRVSQRKLDIQRMLDQEQNLSPF